MRPQRQPRTWRQRRRRPPNIRRPKKPPETVGGTKVQKSGAGSESQPVTRPPALARLRAGLFVGGRQRDENEMDRDQKTAVVDELATELKDATAIFAVDYPRPPRPPAAARA